MRKLYLFSNTKGNGASGWEICYAMADDGTVLASHACSHIGFMNGDLIDNRPERKEMYEKHFGGERGKAFEVISLRSGETPPKDVVELNTKAGKKAKTQNDFQVSIQEDKGETG